MSKLTPLERAFGRGYQPQRFQDRNPGRTEEKATNPTTLRGETNSETAAPVSKKP